MNECFRVNTQVLVTHGLVPPPLEVLPMSWQGSPRGRRALSHIALEEGQFSGPFSWCHWGRPVLSVLSFIC